jgi:hypothetical protein
MAETDSTAFRYLKKTALVLLGIYFWFNILVFLLGLPFLVLGLLKWAFPRSEFFSDSGSLLFPIVPFSEFLLAVLSALLNGAAVILIGWIHIFKGHRIARWFPIVLIAGVFVAFGAAVLLNQYPALPTDETLLENFLQHEEGFNRVVLMFEEDTHLNAVLFEQICPTDSQCSDKLSGSDQGITQERWDEYRLLMETIGLENGITRMDFPPWGVATLLPMATDHGISLRFQKGYAYSKKKPSLLADTLDCPGALVQDFSYKHIKGNWYLFHLRYIY